MITAVDTNIILDILIPGEPFGESSKALLDRHVSKGKLIICEIVFAELSARFPSEEELASFLAYSGPFRPLIPNDSGHRFRTMAASDSD